MDRVNGIARLFGLAERFGRLDVAIESPFWRILTNDIRSDTKTLDLRRCQDKDWPAFREWATEPQYERETPEAGIYFLIREVPGNIVVLLRQKRARWGRASRAAG